MPQPLFLSPIKEMGQLIVQRLKALPFWWSYILIGALLALIAASLIWRYGLRQQISTNVIANDPGISPRIESLWFIPNGTLVGTQRNNSQVIISFFTPQSNGDQIATFKKETKVFDLAEASARIRATLGKGAGATPSQYNTDASRSYGFDGSTTGSSYAVAQDGSRLAYSEQGTVAVSDGKSAWTIVAGTSTPGQTSSAVAFVDASASSETALLALARANGIVDFVDPRSTYTLVKVDTKLNQPSILKSFGNFILAVSPTNASAVVVDTRSPNKESPAHGYPISSPDRLRFSVSSQGRLAVGTGGSRVFVTGSDGKDASIPFDTYGTVNVLSFYDENRILVGGNFQGVYRLAPNTTPELITNTSGDVSALALNPTQIAYAGSSGLYLATQSSQLHLNNVGKIAVGVLLLFLTGLAALFSYDAGKRQKALNDTIPPIDVDGIKLPAQLPQDLVEVCAAGECVLYAGAGLSAQAGLPIWKDFVHGLLDWATENGFVEKEAATSFHAEIDTGDSDPVADSIISRLHTPEQSAQLMNYLRRVFLKSVSPSPAHVILPRIKFSAVLTTNFDTLLERIFSVAPKQIYTPNDGDQLLTALTKREYFLLKLYGTLDEPETVIVTPAQYDGAIANNRLFSQFMQTLFVSRTLLFIGASLEGIEAYLRGISLPREPGRKHYAVVAVSGNAWRAKADLLERRYGIKVLAYTPGTDHAELTGFLRKLSARAASQAGPDSDLRIATSRLKHLKLENIGPFDSLELDLDTNIQVFLGDNGVGKSTILKAIAMGICGEESQAYAYRLLRGGTSHGKIVLETDNKTSYVTEIYRNSQNGETEISSNTARPLEAEGWLALGFPPLRTTSWTAPKGPDADIKTRSRPVIDDLMPLVKGDIDPRLDKLKQWIVNLDYLSIKGDSSSKTSDYRYRELVEKVFEVIATVTEGMTLRYGGVEPGTNKVIIKTDDGLDMPLEALSQGTISLVGWLGILLQRLYEVFDQDEDPTQRYALVLMDEIDAHMHPLWQRTLINHLKEIFPNVQFIATTHSPLLIGGMPAQQVMRFSRDSRGQIVRPQIEPDMTLGYTDQILTSLLFGLPSSLDDTTEKKKKRYYELYEMKDRSAHVEEYETLKQELMVRIPPRAESYEKKHEEQLQEAQMMKDLGAKLAQVSPEQGDVLLKRAESLRSSLEREIKP